MYKEAFQELQREIRKDIYFFGVVGIVSGLFLFWQSRIDEIGVTKNAHWATDFFTGFIPFHPFVFIFFSHLLLSCIAAIFYDLDRPLSWLDKMVVSLESKLLQLVSAMVAFLLGLIFIVFVYLFLNLDYSGIRFIFLILLFLMLIVSGFLTAMVVGRHAEPFNRWYVALGSVVLLLVLLGYTIIADNQDLSKFCQQ